MNPQKKKNNFLPFLGWPKITLGDLRTDMLAGSTIAMMLIPQSMAYAELAGLPAYYGLYASFIPVILAALWGHLPQIASGPTAMTAIVTASVLMPFASGLEGDDYINKYTSMAILLALCVGVIRLLMGLFKVITLVNFISHPVIIGFTNAGALVICLSQINRLLGIEGPATRDIGFGGFINDICATLGNFGTINTMTMAFGLSSIILLIFFKKYAPKLPGALIVMIIAIIVSKLIGYQANYGSAVAGNIPSGIPSFGLPAWDFPGAESQSILATFMMMIPAAIMVTLIGFMEVLSISKAVSMKTKQPMDLNKDLIAQGVAAVGGFFCQAYPTSASLSRSALSLECKTKTGMANIFTGLGVLIVLLFFTDYFYHLPKSTLSALIIMSVINLVNFNPITLSWKANRNDGIGAIITLVSTILFAPQIIYGIVIGGTLTFIMYMYRTVKPKVKIFGFDEAEDDDPDEITASTSGECIGIMRIRCSLFFASMAYFEEKLLDTVALNPKATHIIVIADGINRIDASGEWGLRQMLESFEENSLTLVFSGLPKHSYETLENTKLVEKIGKENFHPNLQSAISSIHKEIAPNDDYMI
ncbi:MAG: SulP family inorganic anion transporter [Lentisphaeraceae bacterium]|nr:SulP family inorganic anion transporter [Lentisphaeraceae bacterium]